VDIDVSPVEEVIAQIQQIINSSIEAKSPIGYFAVLYKGTTSNICRAIKTRKFEDGPRMVCFDQVFAGRYFDAVKTHRNGGTPTQVWQKAFEDHDGEKPLIILQHLLTAMNAHIDLDLGVTTAKIGGKSIESLHHDFTAVNNILALQVPGVLNAIGKVSPAFERNRKWMSNEIINKGLSLFRKNAWWFAQQLAGEPDDARRADMIQHRDVECAFLGNGYIHPLPAAAWTVDAIRAEECPDIAHNIQVLDEFASAPAALPRKLW
jgi:hypothetical protein